MNKKLSLMLLSVVMFSTVSFAQKVIKNGSAVIIDCTDMDPKFYSSKKIEPRTTTATDNSGPTNGAADISSPESNAKVYKKFEVHKTNNHEGTNWKNAIDVCAGLDSNGIGWRLPTQRELMLMWILKEKLVANVGSFNAVHYWSATQYNTINAWSISFNFGTALEYTNAKTNSYKVRCVRDL